MEILRTLKPANRPLTPPLPASGAASKPISTAARNSRCGRENTPPPHPNARIASPSPPTKAKLMRPDRPCEEIAASDKDQLQPLNDLSDPSLKVVVRVRPPNVQEKDSDQIVQKTSPDSVAVGDRTFVFHSVLGPEATQEDVFKLVGIPLVHSSSAGYNTSVVSYGQTGSGKTYSMWGPPSAMVDGGSVDINQGIVPRIFQMIFTEIQRKQESSEEKQTSYQCRCSFLEIYKEQINDLLDPTQRNLQLRNEARNGIHVENLTDEYVTSVEDVTQILIKGLSNRKVGTTSMNCKSSRSHVIFTCTIESWCKGLSSKYFSSSKASRITFVDLAGPDKIELHGASKLFIKEERHVKKSLSRLGKLVNILSDVTGSERDQNILYSRSCLTHLLQDTLGGNSKTTILCTVSPDQRCISGTMSTLRFGERATRIKNKAVINEITEDDVDCLSSQIRQLKEELIRTKSGGNPPGNTVACFKGHNARESLNLLRVSLNRSLILPRIDMDTEEEMEVDEEDVQELCAQINNLHSSSEDTFMSILEQDSTWDTPRESVEVSERKEMESVNPLVAKDDQEQNTVEKSSPWIQEPPVCSSPRIRSSKLKKTNSLGLSVAAYSGDGVRSSLQSTKLSPTESLAASLHRGLHIIEHHQQNLSPRKSFVGLSFEHLALINTSPKTQTTAASILCSSCKRVVEANEMNSESENSDMQIVPIDEEKTSNGSAKPLVQDENSMSTAVSKREMELEALCAEQAARIEHLSFLVDQHKQEDGSMAALKELRKEDSVFQQTEHTHLNGNSEITEMQDDRHYVKDPAKDCLLEQVRNGSMVKGEEELERERQRWTESESRWINLTEELRQELESSRRLAEKKEMELGMEKKCTAELDDALHRAIHGHAQFVEHYTELQEKYNDLFEKHRRVMEGIAEVKRAATKAGRRKGCGTAFAAALSAELSTLRIDREKERAYLKEQNRRLRIQLRDTAEAVHAAGELLVRFREAEEVASRTEEKYAEAMKENEKLRKQAEKMKKKHAMEIVTMKHYLAESRLPESALEPFYHHGQEPEIAEESQAQTGYESWRSAFRPSYQNPSLS